MRFIKMILNVILLFSILTGFPSCKGHSQKTGESKSEQMINTTIGDRVSEIGKNIRCILQDSKNNIWFGTQGEGLYKYDGKTIIKFTEKDGLGSNFVWEAVEGKDGKIWFGERSVVSYFDGNKFTTMYTKDLAFQEINYKFLNDDVLAGVYYNGQSVVKIKLPKTSPFKEDNNFNGGDDWNYRIYCTYKDSKGNHWFGTQSAGVCKYDGKTYTWFTGNGLSGPAVRCVFEDKNGNIWMGNNGGGLYKYDGKTVTKEGAFARVWTITDDKQGNLWIGTIDAGVWMFDGKTLTNYTTKGGPGVDFVWTIYKDKNDNLWFGTDGDGVYTFDGKKYNKFNCY